MERNVLARGTQYASHTFLNQMSHLSASTPVCFLSSAISVIIWILAISSFTRSRHLSFGLPPFRFPSTDISYIFLVASSAFAHVQTISTSSLRGILPLVACVPLSQTSIVYLEYVHNKRHHRESASGSLRDEARNENASRRRRSTREPGNRTYCQMWSDQDVIRRISVVLC